jgi:hypothetical protein
MSVSCQEPTLHSWFEMNEAANCGSLSYQTGIANLTAAATALFILGGLVVAQRERLSPAGSQSLQLSLARIWKSRHNIQT